MIRKIIHIDEEKCNGCGLCAKACHEGAIDIVDGKAKLMREHFCDGFGDCLPNCPTGAITFEEREAPAYDEAAVKKAQAEKKLRAMAHAPHEGGCPGSRMAQLRAAKRRMRPQVSASRFPVWHSGRARSSWCRRKRPSLTARGFWLPPIAPHTHTPICMRSSCAAK